MVAACVGADRLTASGFRALTFLRRLFLARFLRGIRSNAFLSLSDGKDLRFRGLIGLLTWDCHDIYRSQLHSRRIDG